MEQFNEEFGYLENLKRKKPTETEIDFKIDSLRKSIEAKERQSETLNDSAKKAVVAQIRILESQIEELQQEKNHLRDDSEREKGIGHA